jgi:hypothetical protein
MARVSSGVELTKAKADRGDGIPKAAGVKRADRAGGDEAGLIAVALLKTKDI